MRVQVEALLVLEGTWFLLLLVVVIVVNVGPVALVVVFDANGRKRRRVLEGRGPLL
jgi:hypothetical protein